MELDDVDDVAFYDTQAFKPDARDLFAASDYLGKGQ
jgi:hypothetical protein